MSLLWKHDLDWHDQESVAVEIARVLQSLAIDLAMIGCAVQGVSSQHTVAPRQREGVIESAATIFMSAPMALSRGVTAIRLPLS
jgi:hypothetical protein